jgi:hypothetical protein
MFTISLFNFTRNLFYLFKLINFIHKMFHPFLLSLPPSTPCCCRRRRRRRRGRLELKKRTMIRAVKEVIRLEKENKLQKEEIERLRANNVQGKIDVKLWVSFVLVLNFV